MSLHAQLLRRQADGKPIRIGLIGAGKFGTMFLSQARLTEGMHVVGVADINVARAKDQLKTAGWPAAQYAAATLGDALKSGATIVTGDSELLLTCPEIEVIVDLS